MAAAALNPVHCRNSLLLTPILLLSLLSKSDMTGPTVNTCSVVPMAIQAPPHLETGYPPHTLHGRDIPMTDLARHLRIDMHLVREIDMIGKIMNLDPGDRFLFLPVPHELFDFFLVPAHNEMAILTGLHIGDTG
jgi:hypothetical protein